MLSKRLAVFFIYSNLIFLSCIQSNNEVEIKVFNKTDKNIDSLYITNWINDKKIKKISKNDSVRINLGFKNNTIKSDGNYSLSYYINKEKYISDFGYYSNGIPTNSKYIIKIYNDTLTIKEQTLNQ